MRCPLLPRRNKKRRIHWGFYLWPGLPHLWNEGSWAGLALAVGFTGLLNATILAVLVWPQWLPERVKLACGLATGLIWLAALWETRNELRRQAARLAEEAIEAGESEAAAEVDRGALDSLFCEAQKHYLAGDWLATERSLVQLLRRDPSDIEAQLLLATLFRVTGDTAKARRALDRLARRADAVEWLFEVKSEQQQLETEDETPETEREPEDQAA